ncbi:MAG TPA: hydantoinase/oxoprolinase family protein [Methylomirabilota bacterium]|nr:hydantoinase/oxoprolinase family protein [Methylomirabilota bacterium]
MRAKLAADIGGTFTDVVLESPTGRDTVKVLTTAAPEVGVLEGIRRVLASAGLPPSEVSVFVHGTTLATNALIERKGARAAFVTTEGMRDILEMGYEKRFEQYDVYMERPLPLVPRPLRFTVRGRLDGRGRVLRDLDEREVRALGKRLAAERVGAVAIGFMHAYAWPQHEQRAAELLRVELPADVTICLSSEVCPEIREYERFSTTCANAYVRPMMQGYLLRLRAELDALGMTCPLLLMMSGGGLTTLEIAARFPVRLVESGPAGGALLSSWIARERALDRVLSFDMGGTTAKICLIDGGEPERARTFEVARAYRNVKGSGLPVRVPVIEMVEIGAGGGSIARVDRMQRITVGPDSAGADPGPASYGRGGSDATVTDADLVLGRIDPERFADGTLTLDTAAAEQAVVAHVGAPLGLDAPWHAAGVSEIVEENMANAARVHAIERGRVIGRYTMIAFGGGAPLHAGRLAEKLGVQRVVVPEGASVGSAIGFLRAPVSFQVVRSHRTTLSGFDAGTVNELLDGCAAAATDVVRRAVSDGDLAVRRVVDMRYIGQGHELQLALPQGPLQSEDARRLRSEFEKLYGSIYGVTMPDQDVEFVTWSVTVSAPSDAPVPAKPVQKHAAPAPRSRRDVYEPALGRMIDFAVYRRNDLDSGSELIGPALIEEGQTTTVVPASFTLHVDGAGYLVMESRDE